jgi:hypothetical protein
MSDYVFSVDFFGIVDVKRLTMCKVFSRFAFHSHGTLNCP